MKRLIFIAVIFGSSILYLNANPKDIKSLSVDSVSVNIPKSHENYQELWKEAIETIKPIYESTNRSVTLFGSLISGIVALFSIIITITTLVNNKNLKDQFRDLKDTFKKEELINDIQKNIPEQINQQVEKAVMEKFDKEYKDKIFIWTRDQVENTMGWSLKHREIMQSYQRKEAQKIALLIKDKFEDDEFSKKVYELLLKNVQDTLTMYKVLSGDIDTIKSGLMDFTAHPVEVFSEQLKIVKLKYIDSAEIQEHIIKAENSLHKIKMKDNGSI